MAKTPLQILLDAYWTPQGWRDEPLLSDNDRKVAEEAGYMFPPQTWTHDQAIDKAMEAVSSAKRSQVVRAYLIGLGGKEMHLRSALASYTNGLALRKHRCVGRHGCNVCGFYPKEDIDWNVLNFERYKFGGVRHSSPDYIALDLRELGKLDVPGDPQPGIDILRAALNAIVSLPSEARASDAEKMLKGIVSGNTYARRAVLETLGYGGILRQHGTQPVWQKWYEVIEKEPPSKPSKNDWSFPMNWWRGSDGVDMEMARHWFGEFGLD